MANTMMAELINESEERDCLVNLFTLYHITQFTENIVSTYVILTINLNYIFFLYIFIFVVEFGKCMRKY